jgi:Family of unknown function (DUF5681)
MDRGNPAPEAQGKNAGRANPRGRSRSSPTLAEMLRRALDAPADDTGAEPRRPLTKREMVVRGLVERATEGDLAATRLLFDMLRKADPRAVAASDESRPLGQDAIAMLKERLARLAAAQAAATPAGGNSSPQTDLPSGRST